MIICVSPGYDKDNAVSRTENKIEDKWEMKIKKLQDHWKEREYSHLQKISILETDKEALTKRLRDLRDGEFENIQEISHLKQIHQNELARILDLNRRTVNDNTRELKKMDELLKDKEDEIAQFTRKVDVLELDKELLEKELLVYKKRIHGHDASIKSAGINFTLAHKDLTKKIAGLEGKVRQLQIEKQQMPQIRPDSQMGHASSGGHEDKITRYRRQREELKDIVTRMEEKCNDLETRCTILEEDHTVLVSQLEQSINEKESIKGRLSDLKQECDLLRHENIDLHENIRDFPVDDYEQVGRMQDQRGVIMELQQCREDYLKEIKELNEQKEGLMIRCEKLKDDYQIAKEQTTRLLEEREDIKNQETQQEKQIARLRDRTVRLEQNQDRWKNKMEEQRAEIDRLQNVEQRAMQADAYKRQLDELKRQF